MPDELETCIQCGSELFNGGTAPLPSETEAEKEKKTKWLSEQTKIKGELQDLISRLGGDPLSSDSSTESASKSSSSLMEESKSLLSTKSMAPPSDEKTAELMKELDDLRADGYIVTRLENAINTDPSTAWKVFSEFLDDVDKLNELKSKLESIDPAGRELQISHIKSKLNNPDLVLELEGELSKLEQSPATSELGTSAAGELEAREREPAEMASDLEVKKPPKEPVTGEDVVKKLEELVQSGKNAYRDGKFKKAIEFLDKALILDPSNKQVQFFKKKTLTKLKESKKADKKIKAAQDELGTIAGESAFESWDDETEPKGKKAGKAKKPKKEKKKKKKKKGKAKPKTEEAETRSATELEALGFNAFINKDYEKALDFYQKVMAQDPNFPGVQARIDECKGKLVK